jgi:hypothetical protein
MNKGSVTIGDVTIPISDIYLDAGQVTLTCQLPNPSPWLIADHYDVYDRGGQLVYRCPRSFNLPPLLGSSTLTFQLLIAGQTATPGQGR